MVELTDAQAMHREFPRTFHVPPAEHLAALNIGFLAKVCAEPERFWVVITARSGDRLRGIVDNDLLKSDEHGLHVGDTIEFEERHVYAIEPPSAQTLAIAKSAAQR